MPTPEALSLAHLIRHAVDMSDEDCASEIDRFAAQRGAEAQPLIVIEQGKAGLWYAVSDDIPGLLVSATTREELKKAIPSAIADLERALGNRKPAGAPPQTGGGDAGERDYLERAHAVLRDGHRRHLREPPGGKNLTLCEVDAIAAALRSSHREAAETISDDMNAAHWHGYREGAEAMRAYCVQEADDHYCPTGSCGHDVAERLRALPIPGKTDAG